MALQDDIFQEIRAGRLQAHWTASDLLANAHISASYSSKTLGTHPANKSASLPGLDLGSGYHAREIPLFYRVGRREGALLFALPAHVAPDQHAGQANVEVPAVANQRMRNRRQPAQQGQASSTWSVENEQVRAFIDWVAQNERHGSFRFSYHLNGNLLQANTIYDAAQSYRWNAKVIPSELIDHIEDFPRKATNLQDTVILLNILRQELRNSLASNDMLRHLKACWATLYWGGVANGLNLSFYGLRYLSGCYGSPNNLIEYHRDAHNTGGWFDPATPNETLLLRKVEDMSAGITKVHSLLSDELVIYDSRVASALSWLVERYCDSENRSTVPNELLFCLPPDKAGKEIKRDPAAVRANFPRSLVSTNYKLPQRDNAGKGIRLWTTHMLRASLILSGILKRLGKATPEGPARPTDFLEYQLGLFMIGYHLGDHRMA